jgi:hypothetical protein
MTTATNERTDRFPLFHPPGVIRVVTPAESATEGHTTLQPSGWENIKSTLKAFARAWVAAQAHRAGP